MPCVSSTRGSMPVVMCLFIALVGIAKAAEPMPRNVGKHIESLVFESRESVKIGDFQSAWEAYRELLPLVISDATAHRAFYDACESQSCPAIGQLAWLVGSSQSDLQFLDEALKGPYDKEAAEQWQDFLMLSVYQHVGRVGGSARREPTEAWLYFPYSESGDHRPVTPVRIGNRSSVLRGLIDSGAYRTQLTKMFADESDIEYEFLTSAHSATRWDGSVQASREVVIKDITISEMHEETTLGILDIEPQTPVRLVVLGASLLFRHDAVCFSWHHRVLYLGQLGPCSFVRRVAAVGAQIDPALVGGPTMVLPLSKGRTATALVDTGATGVKCKESLTKELGNSALRFGEHSLMVVHCNPDTVPIKENYRFDIVIGMETLVKFSSFGWELNPFRLYFLPRTEES